MKMDDELFTTVTRTLAAHQMLPEPSSAPVVLMVSGGSDSLALAHILPELRPQTAFTILHVNHQLRGQDADADEDFVVEFARLQGLPCEVVRANIAALAAETGDNIEQCGRKERYKAAALLLDQLCDREGVDPQQGRIAVAHTLDDRVETFFMRAIIGGGASGLSSIPYRNGRVIRPLLDCKREELRQYLLELQSETASSGAGSGSVAVAGTSSTVDTDIPWREDASNYDTQGFRAFVRHELLPLATTRNPLLLDTVGRSLQVIGDEDEFLEEQVRRIEDDVVKRDQDGLLQLDATVFSFAKPLIRRVIRNACIRALPPEERITFAHVSKITDEGQRVGFITTLPGNVTVKNEYGTLTFQPAAARVFEEVTSDSAEPSLQLELVPGESCELPDGAVVALQRLTAVDFGDEPLDYARSQASDNCVFVDGEALEAVLKSGDGHLLVTGVRTGDVFCPLGMDGRHKLISDVLVDRKIPARIRPKLKVVRTPHQIIWIVGVQLDDRFKVTPESNTMFRIESTASTRG